MEDKCPFCRCPAGKKGSIWQFYDCGTVKNLETNEYEQDFQCLKLQLATLQAELKAFRECFEATNSDCHELIKQNAALQVQIAGMEEVIAAFEKAAHRAIERFEYVGMPYTSLLREAIKKAQAILSPTPAGEWVSVRREDLEFVIMDAEAGWDVGQSDAMRVLDRLKAALGTGKKE